MSMSDSEVQRLWQAMNALSNNVAGLAANIENNHVLLSEVRSDVKNMASHGCAKSYQHDDHEKRLRDVEQSRNLLAGGAAVAGSLLGIIGSWLVKKIGG